MSELDDIAEALERITRVPETVLGSVEIVAVSPPRGRAPYQECLLDVIVSAPGAPAAEARLEYVLRRTSWPVPGTVLAARVPVGSPEQAEILWDAPTG